MPIGSLADLVAQHVILEVGIFTVELGESCISGYYWGGCSGLWVD